MRNPQTVLARRILRLSALTAALGALPIAAAQDPWKPGVFMRQSMITILAAASAVESRTDYGFWDTCYLGAFLRPGNDSFLTTRLERGESYAFIAAGNKAALDVDLIIEDEQGQVVSQDIDDKALAALEFQPQATQAYTIRLKLHRATQPCFCGVALMKKGGWAIPAKSLDQAMDNMLRSCENAARQTSLKFLDMPGEWAAMALVVRPGQFGGFNDIRMGTGRRVLTCGGDAKVENIDLWLYDVAAPEKPLRSDTDPDAVPIVDWRTLATRRYGFTIKNAKSQGPGLIMTAQLQAE